MFLNFVREENFRQWKNGYKGSKADILRQIGPVGRSKEINVRDRKR